MQHPEPNLEALHTPDHELDDQRLLALWQNAVFVQRTHACHQEQKRRARAAGEELDYRLEDLRVFVRNNLGDRRCHYCRGEVRADNFALDPRVPAERGGSYAFHNLAVVCAGCSAAKGSLDYIEFKELMELLRTWSLPLRTYFLERLRAGSGRPSPTEFPRPSGLIALRDPEDAEADDWGAPPDAEIPVSE